MREKMDRSHGGKYEIWARLISDATRGRLLSDVGVCWVGLEEEGRRGALTTREGRHGFSCRKKQMEVTSDE